MKGVEKITHQGKEIAIIFRKNISVSGIQFFTDEKNPLQVGFHHKKAKVSLVPHEHIIKKTPHISSIQELLYIQKGFIRITFYTKNRTVIKRKTLREQDSILILGGIHGVDMSAGTKILEVKQGPYSSFENRKVAQ